MTELVRQQKPGLMVLERCWTHRDSRKRLSQSGLLSSLWTGQRQFRALLVSGIKRRHLLDDFRMRKIVTPNRQDTSCCIHQYHVAHQTGRGGELWGVGE
jgi:hypothetical protein